VFSHQNALAAALAHVQGDPVPPSERSEYQIAPALEALILQCLAKDPAARPASASELAERLAATVPPAAWTRQTARGWWQLHAPRPRTFGVRAAGERDETQAPNAGKQSLPAQTGAHTPVYRLAPAKFRPDNP
jgi:serine/threonine-protein kinase